MAVARKPTDVRALPFSPDGSETIGFVWWVPTMVTAFADES